MLKSEKSNLFAPLQISFLGVVNVNNMILVRKFGTAVFRNNYYFKDPWVYKRDV